MKFFENGLEIKCKALLFCNVVFVLSKYKGLMMDTAVFIHGNG
jgi:hypothetical protein